MAWRPAILCEAFRNYSLVPPGKKSAYFCDDNRKYELIHHVERSQLHIIRTVYEISRIVRLCVMEGNIVVIHMPNKTSLQKQ
jgi:hypothetical protein